MSQKIICPIYIYQKPNVHVIHKFNRKVAIFIKKFKLVPTQIKSGCDIRDLQNGGHLWTKRKVYSLEENRSILGFIKIILCPALNGFVFGLCVFLSTCNLCVTFFSFLFARCCDNIFIFRSFFEYFLHEI